MNTIKPNTEFTVRRDGRVDTFRRETDDPRPAFECERIRVTHLTCSLAPGLKPYCFGTEPMWFTLRGLACQWP